MRLSGERPKTRSRGLRLNRLRLNRGVFVCLIGAMLALGIVKLYPPLATVRDQQERLARLRQRRQVLLAELRVLEAEQRHLATEQGQEWAARRRGYVRPGERRLVFSPETTPEPDEQRERGDADTF